MDFLKAIPVIFALVYGAWLWTVIPESAHQKWEKFGQDGPKWITVPITYALLLFTFGLPIILAAGMAKIVGLDFGK